RLSAAGQSPQLQDNSKKPSRALGFRGMSRPLTSAAQSSAECSFEPVPVGFYFNGERRGSGHKKRSCPTFARSVPRLGLASVRLTGLRAEGLLPRFLYSATQAAFDAQVVVHVLHTGDVLDQIHRTTFLIARAHRARERDFAALHGHFHVRRIDHRIVRQALADVLANALVGALITARTASAERSAAAGKSTTALLARAIPISAGSAAVLRAATGPLAVSAFLVGFGLRSLKATAVIASTVTARTATPLSSVVVAQAPIP